MTTPRALHQISNLKNPLGLGGGSIGNLYHPITDKVAEDTIMTAYENGVRLFDTAPYYGYGLSEARLGKALAKINKKYSLADVMVSTKVGRVLIKDPTPKSPEPFPNSFPNRPEFDYTYEGIMRSFNDSAARLGVIPDILYVHDIGKVTHGDNHEKMLHDFLTSGYKALNEVREKFGIAIGLGVNEIEVCLEIMKQPGIKLDVIMLAGRYTLLEQTALKEFFPACKKHGVAVVAAAPYNSGLLTGSKANTNFNYQPAEAAKLKQRDALARICKSNGTLLPAAAIQFPLQHPQVISVVFGASNPDEVRQSIENFDKKIDASLWRKFKTLPWINKTFPIKSNSLESKTVESPKESSMTASFSSFWNRSAVNKSLVVAGAVLVAGGSAALLASTLRKR